MCALHVRWVQAPQPVRRAGGGGGGRGAGGSPAGGAAVRAEPLIWGYVQPGLTGQGTPTVTLDRGSWESTPAGYGLCAVGAGPLLPRDGDDQHQPSTAADAADATTAALATGLTASHGDGVPPRVAGEAGGGAAEVGGGGGGGGADDRRALLGLAATATQGGSGVGGGGGSADPGQSTLAAGAADRAPSSNLRRKVLLSSSTVCFWHVLVVSGCFHLGCGPFRLTFTYVTLVLANEY